MISVLATYRAKTGAGDELADLLSHYQRLVRMEPGCRYFGAARDPDDPDAFVLFEHYHSREALDTHLGSNHYRDIVVGRIRPLLEERSVRLLDTI